MSSETRSSTPATFSPSASLVNYVICTSDGLIVHDLPWDEEWAIALRYDCRVNENKSSSISPKEAKREWPVGGLYLPSSPDVQRNELTRCNFILEYIMCAQFVPANEHPEGEAGWVRPFFP
jgi:hypothetical protein